MKLTKAPVATRTGASENPSGSREDVQRSALPAPRPRAALLVTAIYAAAMGWLEAVVVVYIHGMAGLPVDSSTPMPPPETRMAAVERLPWVLPVEQTREVATILMLAAVGWLAGSRPASRFGAFVLAFGVWDIAYYVALRVLLGWPRSLLDRDLLFLIPPSPLWHQPVLLPVAISCVMIAGGAWLHRRHERQRPAVG